MQNNVQQQLIDELSQLCTTLESAGAEPTCEKPGVDPGGPRSALELARAAPARNRRTRPARELTQGILPLLDD